MIMTSPWRRWFAACIAVALVARLVIGLAPTHAATIDALPGIILCTADGPVAATPDTPAPAPNHHHEDCGLCAAALAVAAPFVWVAPVFAATIAAWSGAAPAARVATANFARGPPAA